MIAKLSGIVDSMGEGQAVLDVGGVGYLVYCSGRTLAALPAIGEAAEVSIETHVREDHIHLYGFAEVAERDWFRLLITVQGVGARLALAILSAVPIDDLAQAIAAEDKALLTSAPGVGPRLISDTGAAMPLASSPAPRASLVATPDSTTSFVSA
ncbi:MAG: Holliday junction branch migration protein RuvA [Alphaproteobacteria bacterium]